MKKILIACGLFFVILIAIIAIWIVRSFNADAYRKQIIDSLSQMTGRSVEIKGDVTLTWTPFPTVVISKLEIANQENSSSPLMFSVEQVRSEIKWGSLFHRPLLVKKVELKKPVLLLERIKGSQTNFDFPKLFKEDLSQEEDQFLDNKADLSLSMESVYITDGTFIYDNKLTNTKMEVSKINAEGKVDSLDGPFAFNGQAEILGKENDFSFVFDKIEVAQPRKFLLQLTEKESSTNVKIDGKFIQDSKNPEDWLNLSVTIKSDKPNILLGKELENWPEKSIVSNFELDIMARGAKIKSFTLRQLEAEQNQITSFYFGSEKEEEKERFVLDVKNMDYEQWRPFLKSLLGKKTFLSFDENFHFQFDNIKYRNENLPKGEGEIQLEKGVALISNLSLELPFNSSASFDGRWSIVDQNASMNVQLQSTDFRSLVSWLWNVDLKDFPEDVLKNMQMNGKWQVSKENQSLIVQAAVLDQIQYKGIVELKTGVDSQTKIVGSLDDVNLNLYFPDKNVNQLKTYFSLKNNVLFDLKGKSLTFGDLLFDSFVLEGQVQEKTLTLNKLSLGTKEDFSLNLSGEFDNWKNDKPDVKNMEIQFTTSENNPLYEKLKSTFLWESISGPLDGKLSYVSSSENEGDFQFSSQIDDLNFSSKGKVNSLFDTPQINEASYTLVYSDVSQFLKNFPSFQEIFPYLKGRFELNFNGQKGTKDFLVDDFSLVVGKQSFKGKGSVNLKDHEFALDVTTPMLYLDEFIPEKIINKKWRISPLPEWTGKLKLRADRGNYLKDNFGLLQTDLAINSQKVEVSSFNLSLDRDRTKVVFEGTVGLGDVLKIKGNTNISSYILARREIDFKSLAFSGGNLNLAAEFTTEGDHFNTLKNALNGKGNFTWTNGILEGIDLNEASSRIERLLTSKQPKEVISTTIKQSLLHGQTPITELKGDFQIQKGAFSLPEMIFKVKQGEILATKVNWLIPKNELTADFAVRLNNFRNNPSIDLQMQKNKLTLKSTAFEKSIQNQMADKEAEEKKQEEERAIIQAKENQAEIQQAAQEILIQSEKQIQELKNKFVLNPSENAKNLLEQAEENAKEIRQLSVLSELSLNQYNTLQEKAKLLNLQVEEMDQTLLRQDVVGQKESAQKMVEIIQEKLEDMGGIDRRNSAAAILGALLQKSQEESQKVQGLWGSLQKTHQLEDAQKYSKEIADSFEKIQKAWNYARQLEKGVVPSSTVSGTISVVEE